MCIILWFLDRFHCLYSAECSFQQVLQSFGITDMADELGLSLKDCILHAEVHSLQVFQG